MNNPIDICQGQRIWEVVSNHYDGTESQILFFQKITDNPIEYVKDLIQGLHGDLLLLKKNGRDIWPESIQNASIAARIMEVLTDEKTPPKYANSKWRSWD